MNEKQRLCWLESGWFLPRHLWIMPTHHTIQKYHLKHHLKTGPQYHYTSSAGWLSVPGPLVVLGLSVQIRSTDTKYKSCASFGIDFPHKYNSGQDLVVSHKERYTFPSKKEQGKQLWEYTKKTIRDVAYHCSTDCLGKRHPYFTKQHLVMKREVFKSLSKAQKQHLESSMDLALNLDLILDNSFLPFDYMAKAWQTVTVLI